MAIATAASFDELIQSCRDEYEDLSFPGIRRWLDSYPQSGVVAHFQVYFPEELVHAAGLLPMAVIGAGSRLEAKLADSHIGSFICSICRSSLELGLSGKVDFIRGFYTQPICDVARNLAGIWGRNFPQHNPRILYLPQNLGSRHSAEYLRSEYCRLVADLETLTGAKLQVAALRASIILYNRNRELIRELYRIRRQSPWLLSATECYLLMAVKATMACQEHNLLLASALSLLGERKRKPQDLLRVVFEGGFCEQPPLDMLALIEQACYIVDDDLLLGMRWITEEVPTAGDPIANLAQAYIEHSSSCCVQHDGHRPAEQMLWSKVQACQAQAAICAAAKMCEPGLDQQVANQHALDAQGLPCLMLEFEERMSGFERMRMEVETFAESILFD